MVTESQNRWTDNEMRPEAFTPRAEACFVAVTHDPEFTSRDAELIYQALMEQLKVVSFCDYLKRYIYRKAEIEQPFDRVPDSEYLDIIVESFFNRGVPESFTPTTARLRALGKNWLTQRAVSRDVVLLLGFGLGMGLEDVQELLTKGLQEPGLNLTDPREMVCGYCYLHGLGYHKYNDLMQRAARISEDRMKKDGGPLSSLKEIRSEAELLDRVCEMMYVQQEQRSGNALKDHFERLYIEAQGVTAEKLRQTSCTRTSCREPKEITPADIEQVLQAAIPRDPHGNLQPAKKSALYTKFRGSRLTRQRLTDLLNGTAQVTRSDLLILRFFVSAAKSASASSRMAQYRTFTEETNRMLEECGLTPLYTANPFECFLMMCMLSEDPMTAYSDVMERSYMEAAQ